MTSERTMPASKDCEVAILGAMLLDQTGTAADQACAELEVTDFTLDSHRKIFMRMADLVRRGVALDFNTVTEELGKHREIESVGGVSYVTSLTDGLPRVKNIHHHVSIVKEKAALRQIIHRASGAVDAAYESAPSTEILHSLDEQILGMLGDQRKGSAAKIADFSGETWARLLERRESANRLIGFSTGVDSLDFRTGGIQRKQFWTIGGRTGDGKTSLALQIAAANAAEGIGVGFFSLEMDRDSLLERVWSTYGRINYGRITNPKLLSITEAEKLVTVREQVDRWPLFIEDEPAYSISEIEARARLMVRQHQVGLVIVDYLQIVDAPGREERHRLTRISKGLRMLAKAENIAVVGISQMPRPRDADMNKRPTKFDLKESGSLENDSHTVLLIFRPVDDTNQYIGKDEIVIAKQRSGETGIEPMFYDGKHVSFFPREEQ